MKILKEEYDKMKSELDQLAVSAFFLETYAIGIKERVTRLKAYLAKVESLRPVSEAEQIEQHTRTTTA
jgi:hypothetical protein